MEKINVRLGRMVNINVRLGRMVKKNVRLGKMVNINVRLGNGWTDTDSIWLAGRYPHISTHPGQPHFSVYF